MPEADVGKRDDVIVFEAWHWNSKGIAMSQENRHFLSRTGLDYENPFRRAREIGIEDEKEWMILLSGVVPGPQYAEDL